MPQGKKWSSEECEALAEAWINVSEDKGRGTVKGADQSSERFWSRIVILLEQVAVRNKLEPAELIGKYHHREVKALKNQWTDKLARDVRKFNKCIAKVHAAQLTGVDENQKINIAIALVKGKIDVPSSRYKDMNPGDWMYYRAWLVLKDHTSFRPPSPKAAIDLEEEEEELEDAVPAAVTLSESTDTPTTNQRDSELSNVSSMKKASRGPGPGKKKSKALDVQAKYRKEKMEKIDMLVAEAKKKTKLVKRMVSNNAHTNAWKVVYMANKATNNPRVRARMEKRMLALLDMGSSDSESEEEKANDIGVDADEDSDGDIDLGPPSDDDERPNLVAV
jgi:hypothetical protein